MGDTFSLFSVGDAGWGDEIAAGLLITVELALTTLPIGIAIGLLVAWAKLAHNRVARTLGTAFTTVFRGIPELLTLFIVYNGVGMLLNATARMIDEDADFVEFSPFAAGVTALSLVFGAFAGEVFRGAFQSLDKGQIEAARAFAMSPALALRRILLPQAWRFALPGLGNLWMSLVKDTALVSVIALNDLLRMTNVAVGSTKQPFVFYLVACFCYWMICSLSGMAIEKMETHANRGIRRA